MKKNIVDDFLIILPTHSKYIKIVENFLELLEKNWNNCPFKIIVSITGEEVNLEKYKTLYNGKNATLIDCLVNVTKKYKYKYYISFLGDAFISKKIDNGIIIDLFEQINNNNIEYCCLNYVRKYKKEKKFSEKLRYINGQDRYSHSFVSFVASYKYITNELSKFNTDLQFEMNYLKNNKNFYYNNHLIVRKNYLKILPGITKGKWDRINYHKLKKFNPTVKFVNLQKESWIESCFIHASFFLKRIFPQTIRKKAKKIIGKEKFVTED